MADLSNLAITNNIGTFILRPLHAEDIDILHQWMQDLNWYVTSCAAFINWKAYSTCWYGIYDSSSSALVGSILLRKVKEKTTYLSEFMIHPNHRGKGLGTDVLTKIMAQLESSSIILDCVPDSFKFYSRFGFIQSDVSFVKIIGKLTKIPDITKSCLILDLTDLDDSQTGKLYNFDASVSQQDRRTFLNLWLYSENCISKCAISHDGQAVIGYACLQKTYDSFGLNVFSMFYANNDIIAENLLDAFRGHTIDVPVRLACPALNQEYTLGMLKKFGNFYRKELATEFRMTRNGSVDINWRRVYSITNTDCDIV